MPTDKHDINRGKRLRAAREKAGLSKAEVARRLGVHRNSPGNWENGTRPAPEHAGPITALYRLPEDFFFDPRSEFERKVLEALAALRDEVSELKQQVGRLF